LLKLPENKFAKKKHTKVFDHSKANKENSWEGLEDNMVDKLNNIPSISQARRSRGSGNTWFEKGDVLDMFVTMECKERTGKELKSGEKSMSIKREWLEKATEEARGNDRVMALPFRFKGDENTYIIMEDDSIIELINTLKAYKIDNDAKSREMELLKQKLKDLEA
jgi:hypothetical protein